MRGGVRAHHASRLTVKGCVLGGWACHGKINDFLSDFFRGGETRLPTYPLPPHKPPFAPTAAAAAQSPPLHKETTQIKQGPVLICFVFPAAKCLIVTVSGAI